MNKKITNYIEERRNDEWYNSINKDSRIIDIGEKNGWKVEVSRIDLANELGKFDDSTSWKLFVMGSLLLNVILMGFFILRSS